MDQRIEKAIELINMFREDNPSCDAKIQNEFKIWHFMVDNYFAFKNGQLSQDQINKLNDVTPGWIEHMETQLISVYDEFTKGILDER